MDLEHIAKVVSLGNLISYSFVNAAVIALRYRQPPRNGHYVKAANEKYAWLYLVSAFVFSLSFGYGIDMVLTMTFGVIMVGCLIVMLFTKQPNAPTNTFKCPLVPLVPCIGILGNFMLCTGVNLEIWVYFIVFEILGVSFYFGYGL